MFEIINLFYKYVSLYVNTIKYLPDTNHHSYDIVMSKVVRAKAVIRKDDKSGLYFSVPSQMLTY